MLQNKDDRLNILSPLFHLDSRQYRYFEAYRNYLFLVTSFNVTVREIKDGEKAENGRENIVTNKTRDLKFSKISCPSVS